MGTLTDAKVVIPRAFPMLVSQQPLYFKACASPKALTYSRREVPGRKHAHTVRGSHVPSSVPCCCQTEPSALHLHTLGDGQEESSLLGNQKGQLSRVKRRRGLHSSVPSGCLTWAPTPARERTAKAYSRHSLSSLPGAQAKTAWGRWSHYPAGSPFLTPPHMRGLRGSGGVAIPCALRLPICVLG